MANRRYTVDATHMASTDKWREFVGGLRDAGEVSITINFVPGGAGRGGIVHPALAAADGMELQDRRVSERNPPARRPGARCCRRGDNLR